MITDIEKFIEIQRILALSDIPLNDCIKINGLIIDLSKENKKLKKQLEEANNFIKKSGFVNIEQVMLNYCGLLIKQKEFIKYLEDENKKLDIKANGIGASSERDELITKARTCRKISKKYREIIGE